MRANKQIWRLARYINTNFIWGSIPWDQVTLERRHHLYDQATELLKKINNNEFTGPDNHE